jgi:putrescine transport system substrate-binding protein
MKTAIGGSLLGAALLLAANGGGCAEEEKVLKIYNWPDYIAQDTVCGFEARTGIDVV